MMIQKKNPHWSGFSLRKGKCTHLSAKEVFKTPKYASSIFFFLQLPETEAAQSGKYLPLHHPHSQLQAAATRNKTVP